MNIRKEIENYSSDEDKPTLRWLFSKYHWASEWRFVSRCRFERYGTQSYQVSRVWLPSDAGRLLFKHREELDDD